MEYKKITWKFSLRYSGCFFLYDLTNYHLNFKKWNKFLIKINQITRINYFSTLSDFLLFFYTMCVFANEFLF
jgi:hypothetical protein